MARDLYLNWNGDLVLAQDGDLQEAVGWDHIRQRIIRRMITNPARTLPTGVKTPADYIFHQDFGFGLGAMVDGNFTTDYLNNVKSRITQAVMSDAEVSTSIPPNVTFQQPDNSSLWILIGVTLASGEQGQISLQVTG